MLIATLLAALVCPPGPGGGDLWLETVDGRLLSGQLLSFSDGRAQVHLDGDSSASLVLEPGELLLLKASGRTSPVLGPDVVLLARDPGQVGAPDRLAGQWLGGDDYGLRLQLMEGVELDLPFETLSRLLPRVDRPLDLLTELPGAGRDDRVWRRRSDGGLDGVAGVLARVDAGSLVLESALGDLPFALSEVLAVVLAEPDAPPPLDSGWPCRVALAGGSCFSAGLLGVSDGVVRLSTRFSGPLSLPLSALDGLLLGPDSHTGPRLLSASAPVEVQEWSALAPGEQVLFPWRAGLAVAGGPLSLSGVLATSGLGVHAHARLVFEVPPGSTRLRVGVGVTDDVLSLPAQGSVTFRVSVDGESVAVVGPLTAGAAPEVLRLQGLRAGARVELLADAGGDDEAGDRAAWIDGVFLP